MFLYGSRCQSCRQHNRQKHLANNCSAVLLLPVLLWLVVCVLHLRGKGGVFVGGALSAVVGDLEGKARLEARQHGDRQMVPAQTRELKKKKKRGGRY
jgi:hypothetical protein